MAADIATSSRCYRTMATGLGLVACACNSFADEASAGDEYMYSAGIAMYLVGFYSIQLLVTLALSAWKLFGKDPGSAASIFGRSLVSMAGSLLAIWMLSQMLPDSLFVLFLFAIAVLPPAFWYLSFRLRRR
ncbi:hypothetical protein [Lysobacter sp. ESA13C]|uniref:hypothetical protein n=1 Tax=unclassified Lysobacter TaxID=2635362 RepID=UPI001CBAE514|nr:hypothetical protein [Lysobacter sp. ESA13C]